MKILESKGPSQGVIRQNEPHECSPLLQNLRTSLQEETLKQERCAETQEMAKGALELKEKDKVYIIIAFECLVSTTAILNETRGKNPQCTCRARKI